MSLSGCSYALASGGGGGGGGGDTGESWFAVICYTIVNGLHKLNNIICNCIKYYFVNC